MKKILVYFSLYFMVSVVLANNIVLKNDTNYPEKGKPGTIGVQWATSTEDTQKANKGITNDSIIDLSLMKVLSQKGHTQLSPPEHSQYFRVVVWSTGKDKPDFVTNWVNIIANKTYIVKQDQLIPAVLMSGAGC